MGISSIDGAKKAAIGIQYPQTPGLPMKEGCQVSSPINGRQAILCDLLYIFSNNSATCITYIMIHAGVRLPSNNTSNRVIRFRQIYVSKKLMVECL